MNISKMIMPKSVRWYTKDGEGVYEVKAKTKDAMKAVTIREAREMRLLPSVTSILQILAKPELEAWKIEQGILAALTLPRLQGEPDDAFAKRVVVDMDRQSTDAADFGTTLHAAIKAHLTGDIATLQAMPSTVMPFLDEFVKWQEESLLTVYHTEDIVVNATVGYAGRLDFHGRMDLGGVGDCVVDFKTQNTRGRVKFYDEWGMQLAAYAHTIVPVPASVSVVMDSQDPAPPIVKIWENQEEDWEAFLSAFRLWRYIKKYDPAP